MDIFLKYDLRTAPSGPPVDELYDAFVEQCRWADQHGITGIRLHEHHRSEDSYLPSSMIMAAAAAAATKRLLIRCSVIVLPLHDPIRVAEDLAVLDNLSKGRLQVVVAAGYVRSEFEMFGKSIKERIELLESGVSALRQAWTGEEFQFLGRSALVRPRPYRDRQIPVYLGGSSVRAARQAARIADGFEPAPHRFIEQYRRACIKLGQEPGWTSGPGHELRLWHVSEAPDRSWSQLAPFALRENDDYLRLTRGAGTQVGYVPVTHADQLRSQGAYRVALPNDTVEMARRLGPSGEFQLHPMMGGMPPEIGWESLRLFESQVMPELYRSGLL